MKTFLKSGIVIQLLLGKLRGFDDEYSTFYPANHIGGCEDKM